MPDRRRTLGAFGEQAAADLLIRRGHRVLARRWRCPLGEIDLITEDGPELVFVEVRARRGGPPGAAAESVGRAKRARLARLAYSYLAETGDERPWRIDVVAVELDASGRVTDISHIPSAVEDGAL